MSGELERAIRLREQGRLDEALRVLQKPLAESPEDPKTNYEAACVHDSLGREREAIPFYERAIENGLSGKDLEEATLGLGSTYRVLGDYRKAVQILRSGVARFPENRSLQVFLSMALHNVGEHAEAMEVLLRNLAETTSDEDISRYRRAILFYADRLGEIQNEE